MAINVDADSNDAVEIGYGGTGSQLTDPGADRILFWDDSAAAGSNVTWLAPGNGLSITATTLNVTWPIAFTSDYSSDFDAAVVAIGATPTTLYVDDATTMSTNVTTPATLTTIILKGGSIDQGGNTLTFTGPLTMEGGTITNDAALTINGAFKAGLYNTFTGAGAVTYGANSVEYAYPEWAGGTGDDSTDCAAAINGIITSGRPVYLNKGRTYLVKSAIAMNQNGARIFGPGTLKGDAASFAVQTQFVSITADSCIIEDITIDGDDNTTGWMVHVSSAANTRIRRTIHTNVGQAAIIIGDTAVDTYIENCYQKDEGYGVLVNDPTGSSGLFVRGNHFEYDGGAAGHGDGVEINAATNGFARFDISNNYIAGYIDAQTNHGIGIGVAKGTRGVISNNIIEDVEADGIHIENESYEIVINGNNVRDIGPAAYTADGHGIAVYDSFNVTVSNNTVRNVDFAYGILVNAYPDTATQNYGNKVIGNSVYDIGRSGISMQGQKDFIISHNTIIGCSAETNSTYFGIALREVNTSAQTCTKGIISNNIIEDSGNTMAQAIELEYVTQADMSYILIKDNCHEGCTNGINLHTSVDNIEVKEFGVYENVTAASPTLKTFGVSRLDSTSTAITATLPDCGELLNAVGRIKTIVMVEASNSSTVSISHHQTSDPEVATFDAVDETGVFMWTGTEWITLFATCTFL